MKLTFLGTAGGRFAVINQLRATGGIILEMDGEMIHIDPGPGALVRAKEYNIKLSDLTAVAVSHCHPDHYADVELVIEAMTNGARDNGGIFIGNVHAVSGGDDYRAAVSPYHLKALEKYKAMKPGEKIMIGKIEVTATKTFHSEPKGIGFVFKGGRKIGYTSDTLFSSDQEDSYKGCDYLILNVLRPRGKEWPKHMDTDQARKLIDITRPKHAILTHFGILMIKAGPWNEAKYIQDSTGVKTIAAKDGMVISEEDVTENGKSGKGVPSNSLNQWIK